MAPPDVTPIDEATGAWTRAQNEVRFWEQRRRKSPGPHTLDQLRQAEYKLTLACEARKTARENSV